MIDVNLLEAASRAVEAKQAAGLFRRRASRDKSVRVCEKLIRVTLPNYGKLLVSQKLLTRYLKLCRVRAALSLLGR